MENIPFFRRTCSAARYVVACVLRGLSWCLMYTIILPLGTMALMALLVLWKDNTTPKITGSGDRICKRQNTSRTISGPILYG